MSKARLLGLARAALWIGSLAGLGYGLHRLEPYARAAGSNGQWQLKWADVPPTLDSWILTEVEQESEAYDLRPLLQRDLYSPTLCPDLAAALARSPWIERVRRVAKSGDGTVTIRADFRQYLTFVVRNGMGYLVDDHGVRLPRQVASAYLRQYGMIAVEGVAGPVPPVGQAWSNEDVAAGLKLVKFLAERCPDNLRQLLRSVDVSNYKNRLNRRDGWLRIRTIHPGLDILWGLPPGEEYGVESPAERKLALLWSLYARQAQLPSSGTIDVRGEDEILYHPGQ